jgi:hypothetical protein
MLLVCDPEICRRLIEERQALGLDSFDEVWEGVYVMSPFANDEHQEIVGGLDAVLQVAVAWPGLGKVRPGVNVSDREEGWTQNYRVPEVVVYLPENPARNCSTHWVGGPDFAVEVISRGDRSRQKVDFYAKVGTRELLIVDRFPWALELHALKRKKLRLVGRCTPERPKWLKSRVLPLKFRLVDGTPRPVIEGARRTASKPGACEDGLVKVCPVISPTAARVRRKNECN